MESASKTKFKTVEEYFAAQPSANRVKLEEMRSTILAAAPGAVEVISYNIPAFQLNGLLVWYAGFKKHIGFYPRVSAMEAFKKELARYESAKGSVQFPLEEPLPVALIKKMVQFRVKENKEKLPVKKTAAKKKTTAKKKTPARAIAARKKK
jgi:uncharacterized protein YdhG (YjbR/CyaY superfamily)